MTTASTIDPATIREPTTIVTRFLIMDPSLRARPVTATASCMSRWGRSCSAAASRPQGREYVTACCWQWPAEYLSRKCCYIC